MVLESRFISNTYKIGCLHSLLKIRLRIRVKINQWQKDRELGILKDGGFCGEAEISAFLSFDNRRGQRTLAEENLFQVLVLSRRESSFSLFGNEHAVAALEFAIALPFLLLLLCGLFDVGRALDSYLTLVQTTREALRVGVTERQLGVGTCTASNFEQTISSPHPPQYSFSHQMAGGGGCSISHVVMHQRALTTIFLSEPAIQLDTLESSSAVEPVPGSNNTNRLTFTIRVRYRNFFFLFPSLSLRVMRSGNLLAAPVISPALVSPITMNLLGVQQ